MNHNYHAQINSVFHLMCVCNVISLYKKCLIAAKINGETDIYENEYDRESIVRLYTSDHGSTVCPRMSYRGAQ